MRRKKFIGLAAGAAVAGSVGYLLSDRKNLRRADLASPDVAPDSLQPDESEILFLASLAPSDHNTQPWLVHPLEPYRWIVGHDRRKWLPAVDPQQRETILALGAFLQNLEYAADSFGYACQRTLLATTNQDERVMEVKLLKAGAVSMPWQCRGWNYATREGMRVPLEGEAAWIYPEGVKPYWRGKIAKVSYEFAP